MANLEPHITISRGLWQDRGSVLLSMKWGLSFSVAVEMLEDTEVVEGIKNHFRDAAFAAFDQVADGSLPFLVSDPELAEWLDTRGVEAARADS